MEKKKINSRNDRNASITLSSEFCIAHTPKAGERHVSRGGILKYNWRLSPTRAKRYLVTRGPTVGVMYARVRRVRGGDSPSLCALVYPYSLSRGTGDGEDKGGCIRSLVDAQCVESQARFTRKINREGSRHNTQVVYSEND